MSRVRTGPVLGLTVQTVLLAGLAVTVGLDVAGWLAGLAYGVVTCVALRRGLRRRDADRLGPADQVTLARGVLVGGVTALVVSGLDGSAPLGVLVPMTAVALALDAVDGWVARRTRTVSALGARFDMEVDAFLILVLSVQVAPAVGPWVLAIGGLRYAFVAAGWLLPWMRGSLPPRFWRKVVAAAQGVLLLVVAADLLVRPVTAVLAAVALALLVESFGHDVGWLWWHRSTRPARPAAPTPATSISVPLVPSVVVLPSVPSVRPRVEAVTDRPFVAHQPV
ncbi:Phosphatidylglycerophosphate synthase [Micromonospora matsumotoense]|uniref:Phosphatidylglycerophosphate synthase n=1 Tax=Micromonospora matsumotoense TaxID=121616 RepID=A0A1C4WZM6_9ACTN|nr:CDP-alcohol phosphatidyltransferase family protein [Micromonospora matsumotoense]SCF01636.1 Phosphatidylglycerophosphate synthase [Micromonospora matsumotoense]